MFPVPLEHIAHCPPPSLSTRHRTLPPLRPLSSTALEPGMAARCMPPMVGRCVPPHRRPLYTSDRRAMYTTWPSRTSPCAGATISPPGAHHPAPAGAGPSASPPRPQTTPRDLIPAQRTRRQTSPRSCSSRHARPTLPPIPPATPPGLSPERNPKAPQGRQSGLNPSGGPVKANTMPQPARVGQGDSGASAPSRRASPPLLPIPLQRGGDTVGRPTDAPWWGHRRLKPDTFRIAR